MFLRVTSDKRVKHKSPTADVQVTVYNKRTAKSSSNVSVATVTGYQWQVVNDLFLKLLF